jgi:glycosyltransferase involved in cell wall biosynthesis
MDADLQHPPEVIPAMIESWDKEGFDIVDAVKTSRGRFNPLHKLASFFFNRIMKAVTRLDMRGSSDFKLLDRSVIETLLECREYNRFFRGLTEWVGFSHTRIGFVVAERQAGTTKWSLFSLLRYSINNIIAFSAIPLRMISALGIMAIILALALGIQTLILYIRGQSAEGFTTVLLSLAFFSGTILLSLGVIGEYLSRMFDEIKSRPIYIKRSGRNKMPIETSRKAIREYKREQDEASPVKTRGKKGSR